MGQDYYKVWQQFSNWYMYLGEDARQEVQKRLSEIRLPGEPGWGKCDTQFMVDYSNRIWDAGRQVIYAWVTEKCEIFYIGRGTPERATNIHSRSKEFRYKIDTARCKVYILCSWVNESAADDIETMLIYHALEKGLHLQNRAKILQPVEVECLKRTGTPYKDCKYPDWIEEHSDVLNAFDSLFRHCLDSLLSNEGVLPDGKFNTDKAPDVRVYWEIDGVCKPAKEWCCEYRQNYSMVSGRILKYGMTPKEALTFPHVSKGMNRRPVEYWESLGFYIGQDPDRESKIIYK